MFYRNQLEDCIYLRAKRVLTNSPVTPVMWLLPRGSSDASPRREISEAIAAEDEAALLEAIVRAEGINASVKYARKVLKKLQRGALTSTLGAMAKEGQGRRHHTHGSDHSPCPPESETASGTGCSSAADDAYPSETA
eukprot:287974-Prorocentrum_minimum.AAC.1